jgi:hypothetical protein
MSRANDDRILRGRLAVTLALWDYEREQILEALGLESNPRAWSTGALVKEINDCIEGQKMLTSALPANKPANGTISGEVSREEIEDWLNDIPLFE